MTKNDERVSSLRDRIFASEDIESKVIEVPQWGVKLEVRALNGRARANLLRSYVNDDGSMNVEAMYPSLIIQSTYDPETGEQVFSDEDVAALNAKSGAALEVIASTAMKLSGMAPEAVAEAGKDSGSTPSDGSTFG